MQSGVRFEIIERFAFEKQWHIEFSASNARFAGGGDFYADPEQLTEFGSQLGAWPKHAKDEVCFELGSRAKGWPYYLLLRAYMYDAVGHAALGICFETNGIPPHAAQADFSIRCEVAVKLQRSTAWAAVYKGGSSIRESL